LDRLEHVIDETVTLSRRQQASNVATRLEPVHRP